MSFPDFPGCITVGSTIREAHRFAVEALEFHIEGMREDGKPIPEPSSLAEVMDDEGYADAVTFEVEVRIEEIES